MLWRISLCRKIVKYREGQVEYSEELNEAISCALSGETARRVARDEDMDLRIAPWSLLLSTGQLGKAKSDHFHR